MLRDYQCTAKDAVIYNFERDSSDLVVIPTAGGKSHVISSVVDALDVESVILQPSADILQQNYDKLVNIRGNSDVEIYSAAKKRKNKAKFTYATIQSAYKHPEIFKDVRLVIYDEAHTFDPSKKTGMFNSFLKGLNKPKIIGLTASPYRITKNNVYYSDKVDTISKFELINRTNPKSFDKIIFNTTNQNLLEKGYLCPITYDFRNIIPEHHFRLNTSGSEYDLEFFSDLIEDRIILNTLEEVSHRKSILVFCSSVAQAERLAKTFNNSEVVTGLTNYKERERIIDRFKNFELKHVFNFGTLTTGFDHPGLDTIIKIRPTTSLSLNYQIEGRLLRIFEGKSEGLIVDFTYNVQNLGSTMSINLVKEREWELYTDAQTESWHGKELYKWSRIR